MNIKYLVVIPNFVPVLVDVDASLSETQRRYSAKIAAAEELGLVDDFDINSIPASIKCIPDIPENTIMAKPRVGVKSC